jgi:hypothetical protein
LPTRLEQLEEVGLLVGGLDVVDYLVADLDQEAPVRDVVEHAVRVGLRRSDLAAQLGARLLGEHVAAQHVGGGLHLGALGTRLAPGGGRHRVVLRAAFSPAVNAVIAATRLFRRPARGAASASIESWLLLMGIKINAVGFQLACPNRRARETQNDSLGTYRHL